MKMYRIARPGGESFSLTADGKSMERFPFQTVKFVPRKQVRVIRCEKLAKSGNSPVNTIKTLKDPSQTAMEVLQDQSGRPTPLCKSIRKPFQELGQLVVRFVTFV